MLIRKLAYLGATSAIALTAGLAAAAPAGAATSDVLTYGSVGGTNVPSGAALSAPLTAPGVFTTSLGNISCPTGSFTSSVTSNPTVPGPAVLSVTGLTFTAASCTDGIKGTTKVVSVGLAAPATASVSSTTSTLTLTSLNVKVVLATLLGNLTCNYGTAGTVTSVVGALSNTGNTLTFTNAPVNLVTGSAACPSSGTFSATFSPITGPGGTVFIN